MQTKTKLRWLLLVGMLAISFFAMLSTVTTVYAATKYTSNGKTGRWEKDGSINRYKEGNTYPTGWVVITTTDSTTNKSTSQTYYFMADGNKNIMDKNDFRKKGGYVYWINYGGVLVKSAKYEWQVKNGKDILMNVDTKKPARTSEFIKYNNNWYYADANGYDVKDCVKTINNKSYCFDKNGKLVISNWVTINGKKYHTDANGVAQTGFKKINNKMYHFADNGVMHTGFKKINDKMYHFADNGVMHTGWTKINNKWYYFSTGGVMQTGFTTISGKTYYLATSGVMQTGWKQINNKWYWFDSNGVMATSWTKIDNAYYNFNSKGVMQVYTKVVQNGNKIYWPVDASKKDGKMNMVTLQYSGVYNITSNHLTKSNGSLEFNGHHETWYSSKEGKVGQEYATPVTGRHLADDGTYRDKDGFIILATRQVLWHYGDIIITSVGPGKVYDCGPEWERIVDVSTNW